MNLFPSSGFYAFVLRMNIHPLRPHAHPLLMFTFTTICFFIKLEIKLRRTFEIKMLGRWQKILEVLNKVEVIEGGCLLNTLKVGDLLKIFNS